MESFSEDKVEERMLEVLEENGWETYGDPVAGERGASVLDERYDRDRSEVVYWNLLKDKIVEINDFADRKVANEVVKKLKRQLGGENIVEANEEFQEKLRKGVPHTVSIDGEDKSKRVQLIDAPDTEVEFSREDLSDNTFHAVNQFSVERPDESRPDVTLLVNGIPIVHVELKSGVNESDVWDAVKDIQSYEERNSRMFTTTVLNVGSSGTFFRYGAVDADLEHFNPWRSMDYSDEDLELRDATEDLLNPETLVDILKFYSFYHSGSKIVPRYMQYRASNKMLKRIRDGEPRRGLVWHTQGSGKSFTMLFVAQKLKLSEVRDRQVLVVVDRKKLEDQMSTDMEEIDLMHDVADSIDDLNDILVEDVNQTVLTTMHKFQDTESDVKADKEVNPVVMVDECHRFFEAKLGNDLLAALPDAFYFGLTGTPVVEGDGEKNRNTFREFSPEGEDYLDRYSIMDGKRDGVITEVSFQVREGFEWDISEEDMDREFEKEFEEYDLQERNEILKDYVNQTQLAELRPRMEKVTADIRKHFDENLRPTKFKGMVVTPSRRAAALYGDEIKKYWDPEEVDVLISADGNDPKIMQKYRKSDEDDRKVIENFKDPQKDPQLLVVCEKLLTGFDAPVLKTMYLDKSMKNHNLLQAIARVNRPESGKANGEIIDYQGILSSPEKAFEYQDEYEIAENAAVETGELEEEFENLLSEMMELFSDVEFDGSPDALQKCLVKLQKEEKTRSKFESKYRDAEDLFESLMPNETLGKKENRERYELLSEIYYKYQKLEEGSDPENLSISSEEVRAKTREILEEHVDIDGSGSSTEIEYEISEPDVNRVKDHSPDYEAGRKGPATVDDIDPLAKKNPAYQKLSERVKDVLQSWRNDEMGSEEAVESYDSAEEEKERLKEEKERRGMNDSEFAVFKLLTLEYNLQKEKAEKIADDVENRLEDTRIGVNYGQARDEIRRQVIYGLKENDEIELAKTDFLEKAVNYIFENRKDA